MRRFPLSLLLVLTLPVHADEPAFQDRWKDRTARVEAEGLAEPFRGIVIDGRLRTDLFPIAATGVSTGPVRLAALGYLDSLSAAQRARSLFPVDDPEWRRWANQHAYTRQGVSFEEMAPAQQAAALGLLRASLSAKGLALTRDIMRLNHTLGELVGERANEYGEGRYWLTLMGEPSASEPWGWQLDGHHLNVNYFVLGDQVVMTPTFLGSEPVYADAGKYAGTRILEGEQDMGLAFLRSLEVDQRAAAVLDHAKVGNHNVAEAFRDNLDLDAIGISARDLSDPQRAALLELIGLYVGNMDDGHAAVKMAEVAAHLDDTTFAWIGGSDADAVFYYRITSPVILIEFDHQRPIALRQLHGSEPTRAHIHTVMRTPNGNDYGKDLLRQHHEAHRH